MGKSLETRAKEFGRAKYSRLFLEFGKAVGCKDHAVGELAAVEFWMYVPTWDRLPQTRKDALKAVAQESAIETWNALSAETTRA